MGSLHGHIPFYLVLVLVLSSNHILAKAHKDFKSESKAQADFKSLIKLAQKKTLHTSSTESVLESEGAVDFKVPPHKELCKSTVEFILENKGLGLQGMGKLAVENALKDGTKIHNHGDANTWAGAAADWAETCENIFAEKSPLTSMKTEFEKLVSIALAVIKKLAGN
ncbi:PECTINESTERASE INHIBITOR-LIKE [Salix purpurea]|uniref:PECTINESTERASE INHIBITOR-LIKE n=1 Tax=Salix purpurea TaxID=77065 RepID=A0A9Q0WYE9_SALPP|nr:PECTINESTERASE INHIBITOR-LIKE [Salix purpurea]